MARVKSTRVVRKAAPTRGTSVLTASALNTRIHRILNAGQELKRYSSDSSLSYTAGTTQFLGYANPFAGIVQGTALNQRIGDSIKIESIQISAMCYVVNAGSTGIVQTNMSMSVRSAMIKIPDTSLVSSSLAALTLTNYVYAGFYSTGVLNNHDNKVVSDTKKVCQGYPAHGDHTTAPYGTPRFEHVMHKKSFGVGQKVTYKTGTNQQNQDNFILTLASNVPGLVANDVSPWTFYYTYHVFFRDA